MAEQTADPLASRGLMSGWRYRPTIGLVMALGFGGLVLVTAIGVYLALGSGVNTATALLRDRNHRIVENLVETLQGYLGPVERQSAFIVRQFETARIDAGSPTRLIDLLTGSLAAVPQVDAIAYIDRSLHVWRVEQQRGLPGDTVSREYNFNADPAFEARLQEMLKVGHAYWGAPAWNPAVRQTLLNYRHPIIIDGELKGAVTTLATTARLSQFVAEDPSTFILLGRDQVLAHAVLTHRRLNLSTEKPLPSLDDIGDPVLAAIWAAPIDNPLFRRFFDDGSGHIVKVNGKLWAFVYRELGGFGPTPLIVGRYFPLSEDADLLRGLQIAVAAGLVAVGATILVSLFLAKRIVRPVRRLAEAANRLRVFDFDGDPAPPSRLRELDEAGRAFNALRRALTLFAAYVPRALVGRLIAEGPSATASREREATIMFTDIVGFSALAEAMPPQDVAAFLNDHFALIGAAVEAEGGTIDKFIGDAAMVGWGFVQDDPAHAARAVAAAHRIVTAIEQDNLRRRADGAETVRVRIGLHSGPVIAGNIGAPGRINYTVVGDTVNIAQRLEALGKTLYEESAEEVTVLLSLETITAAGLPAEEFESIGPQHLMGRIEPTAVYHLRARPENP